MIHIYKPPHSELKSSQASPAARWQPQRQMVQLCSLTNPGQDTKEKHFFCSCFHGIFNAHIQQVGHWLLKSHPNKSYKVNCMEHNLSTLNEVCWDLNLWLQEKKPRHFKLDVQIIQPFY